MLDPRNFPWDWRKLRLYVKPVCCGTWEYTSLALHSAGGKFCQSTSNFVPYPVWNGSSALHHRQDEVTRFIDVRNTHGSWACESWKGTLDIASVSKRNAWGLWKSLWSNQCVTQHKYFRSGGYDCDHSIHPQKTEFWKVRWDPLKPNRLWPRTKMGKHLKKTSQKQSIPSSMTTNGHVSSLYKRKTCKGGKYRAFTLIDCLS